MEPTKPNTMTTIDEGVATRVCRQALNAEEPVITTGQYGYGLCWVLMRRQGSAFTWSAVASQAQLEHAIDEAHRLGSHDHMLDQLHGVLEDLDHFLAHDDAAAFERAYSVIHAIVGVAMPAPVGQ